MLLTRIAGVVAVVVGCVTVAASGASPGRVYLNIQGYGARPVVAYKPNRLNRITGDGTAYVTRLRWRGWNAAHAYAAGTLHVDDCNPDCADGMYTTHPTRLHVFRVRYCHAAHRMVYSRLTIRGLHVGGQAIIDIDHDCTSATSR